MTVCKFRLPGVNIKLLSPFFLNFYQAQNPRLKSSTGSFLFGPKLGSKTEKPGSKNNRLVASLLKGQFPD